MPMVTLRYTLYKAGGGGGGNRSPSTEAECDLFHNSGQLIGRNMFCPDKTLAADLSMLGS